MRWHLRLYDAHGNLINIVDELVAPSYQRRIAQASPVSFGVPSDHPAARDLSLARSWALYRGAENVASGRIIARNITENPWTYEGLTNEVNLEQIILPSRWGEVYRGWDIADVGRDLLKRRRTFRLNTQAHWQQYMVASSNVDLTSNPGYVMIARYAYQGGLRYHKSASITLQFPDPGDGFAWERIRWSEIVGDVTRIRIQYSTDGGQTWSQEMEATNAEDVQMNEEVGVLLSGQGGSIQVRINLYTDDDTSPFYDEEYLAENPGTQQVYGRTPILTGAELMMSKPGLVQPHPSEFPASAGVTLNSPPDWSEATALEAWQDLYDLFGWEWYVDGDNYLHFAERLGVDRTNEIVLRDGTNTILRGLEDFDDEIVNVGIGRGAGEGFAQLEAVYRHEQSIADHDGVEYVEVVEFPDVTDQAALEAKIKEYVDDRAYAKPPLEAELVFPPGEEPDFFLGDTVRAVHPRTGTIVSARVMDIRRQLTENGERWQVGLNAQWGAGSLVDQLSRRAPKEREELLSPPSGFSARGVANGVIELVWQGAPPVQIQHTDQFSVDGTPVQWADLQKTYHGNRLRHDGLVPASKHGYRIRRVDGRKVSSWLGPVVALAKDTVPPATPTGLRVVSHVLGVQASIAPNVEDDLKHYIWEKRINSGPWEVFAIDLVTDRIVRAQADDLVEIRVSAEDHSGNVSAPTLPQNAVAGKVTELDIDGALFSITPSSTPAPSSGSLKDLWDMDPTTGVTFASPPTITFKYPVVQAADFVRIHVDGPTTMYAQMRNVDTGEWVDVAGSAAAPKSLVAGWNIVQFDGRKLYYAREFRVVLGSAVAVNELKFWRIVLADEILAQVLTLTGSLKIIAGNGAIELDENGLRASRAGEITFDLNTSGDAWFGGDVQARTFILPVRPA